MTTEHKHAAMVSALGKPGDVLLASLDPSKAHLIHMVMGICGEAGELLDAVKKHAVYNKPLDIANVVEELGDLEFYIEGLRQELGLGRSETLQANIDKLALRYPGFQYTDAAAQARADKAPGQ